MDKIHYDISKLDGYNRAFNMIVSPRNDGKTTAVLDKCFKAFERFGSPFLLITRRIVEITDQYIDSLQEIHNKFYPDKPYKLAYNSSDLDKGIVDVWQDGQLFCRVIALSKPLKTLKGLFIKNAKYMLFDEFIINTRMGEKYLPDEGFKFKEMFNTFLRENYGLKAYFCGNPYSWFSPYFVAFGVDVSKCPMGKITAGDVWALDRHLLSDELKAFIKAHNPTYNEEDEYSRYAIEGYAVNDANIRVSSAQPQGFKYAFSFVVDSRRIDFYKNQDYHDRETRFWACISKRTDKDAFCFDFKDLATGNTLFSRDDRFRFSFLKEAIRNRLVVYESLECDYLTEEVYPTL